MFEVNIDGAACHGILSQYFCGGDIKDRLHILLALVGIFNTVTTMYTKYILWTCICNYLNLIHLKIQVRIILMVISINVLSSAQAFPDSNIILLLHWRRLQCKLCCVFKSRAVTTNLLLKFSAWSEQIKFVAVSLKHGPAERTEGWWTNLC